MIRLVNILLFISLSFNINGQETISDERNKIDSLGQLYFEKTNDVYSRNIDSAFIFIDSSLFFFQKNQTWDGIVKSLVSKSSLLNYNGNYLHFDSVLHLAHQYAVKHLDEDNPRYVAVFNSLGKNQLDIGNYDLAIEYFQKVLIADNKTGNNIYIASDQNNLGNAYFKKGDYIEALNFYQEAWRNRYEISKDSWRVAKTKRSIAATYQKMNNFSVAQKSYLEAIDMLLFLSKKTDQKNADFILKELAITHLHLGELALENKDWKTAEINVLQAEKYSKGLYVFDKGRGLDILGEINMQQGNYKKALEHCFKSLELANGEFEIFEKHPVKAEKTRKIATLYATIGDWEKALKYYLLAIDLITYEFNSSIIEKNPLPENIYSNLIALDALKGKANCFFQFYQKDKNFSDLEIAYNTYQSCINLIPSLRKSFKQEGSKELLSPKVLPVFERAIELAIILFNETDDSKYLDDAFQFVEGSKAILLLESMNENNAIRKSGIPEDLIKKELELSLEISHFEKLENEEKQKIKTNEDYFKKYNQKLFDLNAEYQTLIENFEKDYPEYKEMKGRTKLVQVKELQKDLLNSTTALIEYFVGNQRVYVFTITSNNFTVHDFEKDDLFANSIVEIRKTISQPPSIQDEFNSYKKYISNGQSLFKQLIEPSLLENINSIIIIPDDVLGLLPFEILLTALPSDSLPNYHLDNMSYLFEQVDISYSYSSTLLSNQNEENQSNSNFSFVGFAPSFKELVISNASRTCERDDLYNLKNSKEEITRIQAIWGGEIFTDEAANVASFKTYAPQSDIIHLATHACIDQNNHQFNKIFFTDDYLSNNDLYNFFSQSRLAVLSACNTGSGQIVKGEGVMSLSRGFIHAGCPSVVMSLWSVDDGSTAKIMERFYQFLKNGKTKDNSLRLAKLDYLSTAKKSFQHPYYWAAFVQFGDARSLCKRGISMTEKYVFGGLIFFMILFLFLRFRKK